MDALTDLLALLLPLSGLYLALGLFCALLERWPGIGGIRPRRAPVRIREPRRRSRPDRPGRPRRAPADPTGLVAPALKAGRATAPCAWPLRTSPR